MSYLNQTYVYKTVGDCQLHIEIYSPSDKTIKKRPGILWLHGGGLVLGNRDMIPKEHVELYISAGYIIASADYRLAPETGKCSA